MIGAIAGVSAFAIVSGFIALAVALALAAVVAVRRRRRAVSQYWAFGLFPLLQVVLLFLCCWVVVRYCGADWNLSWACVALAVLCLAVDGLVLVAIISVRARTRHADRARALRSQLDAYLVEYQETVERMERTARLRHDLRNQVQIVNALAARGEFELAQHHIAAMLKELEK